MYYPSQGVRLNGVNYCNGKNLIIRKKGWLRPNGVLMYQNLCSYNLCFSHPLNLSVPFSKSPCLNSFFPSAIPL